MWQALKKNVYNRRLNDEDICLEKTPLQKKSPFRLWLFVERYCVGATAGYPV